MTDKKNYSYSVAFLGMGIMGASMAQNLASAGIEIRVWNRTKGKQETRRAVYAGCLEAPSIREAVSEANLIFTCLGDVNDVKAVLLGAEGVSSHAKPGSIVVDFSTIGPKAAQEIASGLDSSDIEFLDAPITGGDVGARNGTLTIMVGGSEVCFKQILPYLEKVGSKIELCGPVGSGQSLKLCNQVLCAVTMSAVSEAIHLARKFEIDPGLVVEVLKEGAGGSWALTNLGSRIVNDDLKPGFMLKHMLKDLRLVHENKGVNTVNLPAMEMAESMFKEVLASEEGAGESYGTQAMIKVYDK